MLRFRGGLLIAALCAILAGCSYQATLDKLVSRERQAEIIAIGERFCTDPVSLQLKLHADLVKSVADALPLLPRECPGEGATWQLASYQWNTSIDNGRKRQQEEAVVVGTGKGKWTTVSLRFYAENDAPMTVVSWNVLGRTTKPDALTFIENFERGAKVMRIAGPLVALAILGLILWLVRRRRAKRAA